MVWLYLDTCGMGARFTSVSRGSPPKPLTRSVDNMSTMNEETLC
jgi:hypothetical protein